MSGTKVTRWQWAMINEAELELVGESHGHHAYTEVNPYEEAASEAVGQLWDWAELHIDATEDCDDAVERATRIAERVASALNVLAFGPGLLIEAAPDVSFLHAYMPVSPSTKREGANDE